MGTDNITKEVNVYREEKKSPRTFWRSEVREKMSPAKEIKKWPTRQDKFRRIWSRETRWQEAFQGWGKINWPAGWQVKLGSGILKTDLGFSNVEVTGDLDKSSFRQVCPGFWTRVPIVLAACLPWALHSLSFGFRTLWETYMNRCSFSTYPYNENFRGSQTL